MRKNQWGVGFIGIGLMIVGLAIALLLTGWREHRISSPALSPPLPVIARSDIARSDIARSDIARSDIARSDIARSDIARSENTKLAVPTVNARRLWRDVEALSFKRYTEDDRATARQYIVRSLQRAGWTAQLLPFQTDGYKGINILAERPGTKSEAGVILLGGHYDTVERSPGADDNATAVATVLEAARLWGDRPTERTLRLVLFDLEELGLVGSRAFVQADLPESARANLKGAVILDMVGYTCNVAGCQAYPEGLPIETKRDRGDFLAVIGDTGHPELLASFATEGMPNLAPPDAQIKLPDVLALPVPVVAGFAPDVVRSDHAPFWQQGLGAVLVTDTGNFRNPNYHQLGDRPDSLNREFLTGSAQVVMNAIARLLHG